jgi:hypothetical protein
MPRGAVRSASFFDNSILKLPALIPAGLPPAPMSFVPSPRQSPGQNTHGFCPPSFVATTEFLESGGGGGGQNPRGFVPKNRFNPPGWTDKKETPLRPPLPQLG